MIIRPERLARLRRMEGVTNKWFRNLSTAERRAYLAAHPRSRYVGIPIARLKETASDDWWKEMSAKERKAYLQAHPRSKRAADHSPPAAETEKSQSYHSKEAAFHLGAAHKYVLSRKMPELFRLHMNAHKAYRAAAEVDNPYGSGSKRYAAANQEARHLQGIVDEAHHSRSLPVGPGHTQYAPGGLASDNRHKPAEQGDVWYHGSGQAFDPTHKEPIYLTRHRDEAEAFARGAHLGGLGNSPQVHKFLLKPGRTADINSDVEDALANGDVDEAVNSNAERHRSSSNGARYLEFQHPSMTDKRDDFTARVALHPHIDLEHLNSEPVKGSRVWKRWQNDRS